VTILINNAGIVSGKGFLDCTDAQVQRTMEVNAMAPIWLIRAFLPAMKANKRGHLVTIASSAGLIGVAKLADYCASKFAAVGLMESLRAELANTGVATTVVCPFFVKTGMFDGAEARWPRILPLLETDYAVDQIMNYTLTEQPVLTMPSAVHLSGLFKIIVPAAVFNELMEWFGLYESMANFKGRADSASAKKTK